MGLHLALCRRRERPSELRGIRKEKFARQTRTLQHSRHSISLPADRIYCPFWQSGLPCRMLFSGSGQMGVVISSLQRTTFPFGCDHSCNCYEISTFTPMSSSCLGLLQQLPMYCYCCSAVFVLQMGLHLQLLFPFLIASHCITSELPCFKVVGL